MNNQLNSTFPIGTSISFNMSCTFDGNGWAINGRSSNLYIHHLFPFPNNSPQNLNENKENDSSIKTEDESPIKTNDNPINKKIEESDIKNIEKSDIKKIEKSDIKFSLNANKKNWKNNNFKQNISRTPFKNEDSERVIKFNIPHRNIEMIKMMEEYINYASLNEEAFLNNDKLLFREDKNVQNKNIVCNTIGLMHSILISLHWKYRGIPSWCKPNIYNKMGFTFGTTQYNEFFDDKDNEIKGDGDKLSKNYWNKLKEVIPFLKTTFSNLENKDFSLESFFQNKNLFQLKYFTSLIGELYNKDDKEADLINIITTAMNKEIDDLNKCLFVIIVLTVKNINIDTSSY